MKRTSDDGYGCASQEDDAARRRRLPVPPETMRLIALARGCLWLSADGTDQLTLPRELQERIWSQVPRWNQPPSHLLLWRACKDLFQAENRWNWRGTDDDWHLSEVIDNCVYVLTCDVHCIAWFVVTREEGHLADYDVAVVVRPSALLYLREIQAAFFFLITTRFDARAPLRVYQFPPEPADLFLRLSAGRQGEVVYSRFVARLFQPCCDRIWGWKRPVQHQLDVLHQRLRQTPAVCRTLSWQESDELPHPGIRDIQTYYLDSLWSPSLPIKTSITKNEPATQPVIK